MMRNRRAIVRIAMIAVSAVVLIWSAVQLISYAADAVRTRRINQQLSAAYHETRTEAPVAEPTAAIPAEAAPVSAQASATEAPATAVPAPQPSQTAAQAAYDPFGGYPDNPYRMVNPTFAGLRQSNQDICAWLTIGSQLDTAVVQRDNSYYLNRDYTGRSNVNGAIFLDEQVWLNFRPKAYILYGHNMKTEAMFGMLHKYDQASFLRENSLITFDTIYEDGQFAVFASGVVELQPGTYRYVDYYHLPDGSAETRTRIISELQRISAFKIPLEVTADDQLLVLVTCTGDDTSRRFVAARRLRDGETADSLSMAYWRME